MLPSRLNEEARARYPPPRYPDLGRLPSGEVAYLVDVKCYHRIYRYGDPAVTKTRGRHYGSKFLKINTTGKKRRLQRSK